MSKKVGFVGAGYMGYGIAKNILKHGPNCARVHLMGAPPPLAQIASAGHPFRCPCPYRS